MARSNPLKVLMARPLATRDGLVTLLSGELSQGMADMWCNCLRQVQFLHSNERAQKFHPLSALHVVFPVCFGKSTGFHDCKLVKSRGEARGYATDLGQA